VLKATWHWGSDSGAVKDRLEEPGGTQLHVGLLSAWGSVNCARMFSYCFVGQLLQWRPLEDSNQ
jgi:hypothetical protein